MSDHYHLIIETPEGNLSRGMRQLNGVYTMYFNRRHRTVGHVYQGRYKAILVEKESYLLEPKKGDLPQRAQRKFEIKQEDKLLFSALLCALVK
jgi:REP element-mobilizing transposase RayT